MTNEGLPHLAALKALTELNLALTKVSTTGLKAPAPLKTHLTALNLIGTSVTDVGVDDLATFKKLTELGFEGYEDDGRGREATCSRALPKCKISEDRQDGPDPRLR